MLNDKRITTCVDKFAAGVSVYSRYEFLSPVSHIHMTDNLTDRTSASLVSSSDDDTETYVLTKHWQQKVHRQQRLRRRQRHLMHCCSAANSDCRYCDLRSVSD